LEAPIEWLKMCNLELQSFCSQGETLAIACRERIRNYLSKGDASSASDSWLFRKGLKPYAREPSARLSDLHSHYQ
jgi:hypothetical protein